MGFMPILWWLGQQVVPSVPSLFPAEHMIDESLGQAFEGWVDRQVPTGPDILEFTPDSHPPSENENPGAPPLGGSPDYLANRQYDEDLRQYTREGVKRRILEEAIRRRSVG